MAIYRVLLIRVGHVVRFRVGATVALLRVRVHHHGPRFGNSVKDNVMDRVLLALFGGRVGVSRAFLTGLRSLPKGFCMVSNEFYGVLRSFLVTRVVASIPRVVLSQCGGLREFLFAIYVRYLGSPCVGRRFFVRSSRAPIFVLFGAYFCMSVLWPFDGLLFLVLLGVCFFHRLRVV